MTILRSASCTPNETTFHTENCQPSLPPSASMAAGTMIKGAGEREPGLTSCLEWKRLDQYYQHALRLVPTISRVKTYTKGDLYFLLQRCRLLSVTAEQTGLLQSPYMASSPFPTGQSAGLAASLPNCQAKGTEPEIPTAMS